MTIPIPRPLLVVLAFALVLAGRAGAATYYLSPSGSDSGAGTLASPWRDYTYASGRLSPGDTLIARGGTYSTQGSSWASSGTSSAPITFKAYPGETPVFDPGYAISGCIGVDHRAWLVFDGLTIRNYTTWGFWLGYSDHVTIQHCTIRDIGGHLAENDHGIYVSWGNSNITIRDNVIRHCFTGGGIHFYHLPASRSVRIEDNLITDSYWGIILANGSTDVHVVGNTLVDNGEPGLWPTNNAGADNPANLYVENYPAASAPTVFIADNIASSHDGAGMVVWSSADAGNIREDYDCWYRVGGAPIRWAGSTWTVAQLRAATGNSTHSLQADPRYVNAANGDFRLAGGSPCIDVGTVADAPATDLIGTSRPQGAGYDFGAYEAIAGGGIVSGGTYELLAKHSGKALDVTGVSTSDGAPIQQWTDLHGPNQQWRIDAVGDGSYTLLSRNSGKALDDAGWSTTAGTQMIQWSLHGGANQRWRIEDVGGGYYRLTNAFSGMALDVAGASTTDGAAVIQWPWWGGDNQRWQLVPVPGGGATGVATTTSTSGAATTTAATSVSGSSNGDAGGHRGCGAGAGSGIAVAALALGLHARRRPPR